MDIRNPISRRRMMELAATAGSAAMLRHVPAFAAQAAGRIEKLDAALDSILDTSQPVQRLAEGYGGPGGPAEGPVWWSEGGYLLFSDINGNRRIKYTPGQGTAVATVGTNRGNGLTRDLKGRLVICEAEAQRVTRLEADGS